MQCTASPAEGGALIGCAWRLCIDCATAGLSLTIAESAAATEVPSRCRAGRVVPSEVHCAAAPGGSLVAAVSRERASIGRGSLVAAVSRDRWPLVVVES